MMMLSMACPDVPLTVIGMRGGFRMQRRLADLGLNIGMEIRVVTSNFHGPILVDLKGCRYAIDRRLAHHIFVEPSANA
jgi:Fe2+ transport system protein FeoA